MVLVFFSSSGGHWTVVDREHEGGRVPDTRLIERWLPIAGIGIESVRERTPMTPFPGPNRRHVWWARRQLVAYRAYLALGRAARVSGYRSWPAGRRTSGCAGSRSLMRSSSSRRDGGSEGRAVSASTRWACTDRFTGVENKDIVNQTRLLQQTRDS